MDFPKMEPWASYARDLWREIRTFKPEPAMPSLIPGFEYDIFISYRHNDNRSGWVTEFVKNLEEELSATIKEPVSVYFDINPHDGLLETHNVDKSLEAKLKCLIFIPILSQTYCDPKSFAWQNEFVAFNRLAKEDQFGKDLMLGNGNVASRILPIKIHDLDAGDKTMLENELGGVLRPVNFIYKESGVNRPLKSDDNVDSNLNKTKYRNQINKVANAVKEIINALKHFNVDPGIKEERNSIKVVKSSASKKPALFSLAFFVLLIGSYLYYNYFKKSAASEDVIEKSIAVLPFADMSPGKDQEYLGDGIAEEISKNHALIIQTYLSRIRRGMASGKSGRAPASVQGNIFACLLSSRRTSFNISPLTISRLIKKQEHRENEPVFHKFESFSCTSFLFQPCSVPPTDAVLV